MPGIADTARKAVPGIVLACRDHTFKCACYGPQWSRAGQAGAPARSLENPMEVDLPVTGAVRGESSGQTFELSVAPMFVEVNPPPGMDL